MSTPENIPPRNNSVPFFDGFTSFTISPSRGVKAQFTQLQSTISAATSGIGQLPKGVNHHPCTCVTGPLRLDEDGALSCAHGEVPPDDRRTKACLIHSLAILLIEEAFNYTGMKELPYDESESIDGAITTENE